MHRHGLRDLCGAAILLLVGGPPCFRAAGQQPPVQAVSPSPNEREVISQFVEVYCIACHNRDDTTAGLALDVMCPRK